MKKLFYVFIILLLIGSRSLLKISVMDVAPKKAAGADPSTEQPAPARKEGDYHTTEMESSEITPVSVEIIERANNIVATPNSGGAPAKTDSAGSQPSCKSESNPAISEKKVPVVKTETPISTQPQISTTRQDNNRKGTDQSSEKIETPSTDPVPKPEVTQSSYVKPTGDTTVDSPAAKKQDGLEKTASDSPTTSGTELLSENPTDPEETTEASKCSHHWVWATHTEIQTIPAVCHEEPVYNDGWDEAITVRKIYCSECKKIYEDLTDYNAHDFCFGSFGHKTVIDHYVHHEPELLYYDTIVDEPARDEIITVNDYEYCSICSERK